MPTMPKPECWAQENASAFDAEATARAYRPRPPYPDALITTLADLVTEEPRTILDLGCGPGDLARRLVGAAERVGALDRSAAMVEQGRAMAHGDSPNLRWIVGPAEDAPLDPPYALVTAGESLHWMGWDVVLPRIRDLLTPNGSLALAGRDWGLAMPEEREIWVRYGTNRTFRPLNLVQELESRALFNRRGAQVWTVPWTPTIDEYIGANRSRASYPADPELGEAFERDVRALIERLVGEGRLGATGERLALTVTAGVAWGVP